MYMIKGQDGMCTFEMHGWHSKLMGKINVVLPTYTIIGNIHMLIFEPNENLHEEVHVMV